MISIDIDALSTAIARKVAAELRGRGQFADLIDQSDSPLGPRKHIALCRCDSRCFKVGRRWLAPKELVEKALSIKPQKLAKVPHDLADDDVEAA